jgi:hypothetical protein
VGDRLVCVRRQPFNVTVRYRATGRLIGRLDAADLSLYDAHPLFDEGDEQQPRGLPIAHDGDRLIVSDGWYFICLDTLRLKVAWKRLIPKNDATREPPLRFALKGEHLVVVKQDYDMETIYMLDARTGRIRWFTDPTRGGKPHPLYQVRIHGDALYGFAKHPGQGFYFVGLDAKSGKLLFRNDVKGFDDVPQVRLMPVVHGSHAVARVRDRQDFYLKVFDLKKKGRVVHTVKLKGAGSFGVHGQVSSTVQDGRTVMLSGRQLQY